MQTRPVRPAGRPLTVVTALTAGLLALVLAGCGAGSNAVDSSGADRPTTGGSLVWAIKTEPTTFNPQQFTQAKARLLYYNQFDSLLVRDDSGDFLPWLATSYRISADGLTYTLDLRHDVTFHDGEVFNAAAVKANFDMLLSPGYVTGATAAQIKNLRSVDVVDEDTVQANLSRPDILILDFFASPRAAQISPKSLRESPNLKVGGPDVVGTGPFILDRYTKGKEVHYTRNSRYDWAPTRAAHQGAAHLNEITYRFMRESAPPVQARTSGPGQVI